jgi:Glycosyl hydrolase family 26
MRLARIRRPSSRWPARRRFSRRPRVSCRLQSLRRCLNESAMLVARPPSFLPRARGRFAPLLMAAVPVVIGLAILPAAAGSALKRPHPAQSRRSVSNPRGAGGGRGAGAGRGAGGGNAKADCTYTANSVRVLRSFERMVNHTFDCALVYNNASPDWAGWEKPWFLTNQDPNYNWASWAAAPRRHRQLIVTNNLFPSDVNNTDWLHAGAAGAYQGHARALAHNLVAAGLGNSIIRLAHEANDSSYPYSIGGTANDFRLWREFWRRTAIAMRSVSGAHFVFDWCINAHWRPIPLAEWYPGDDVVGIVGVDAYDSGVPANQGRWSTIYNQADGIREVLRFAKAHDKPVSIPEWGLWKQGGTDLGGGDDPTYVNGIANVVKHNRVAYQAYFYNLDSASLLNISPLSLRRYRRHFGGGGDGIGAATVTRGA